MRSPVIESVELGKGTPEPTHRLADSVLILEKGGPDVAVAALTEPDPWANRHSRLAGQLDGEVEAAMVASGNVRQPTNGRRPLANVGEPL